MNLTPEQQAVADRERDKRIQAARDRCAGRISAAQSIGQSDGALHDLKFSLRRIEKTTDAQLFEQASSTV